MDLLKPLKYAGLNKRMGLKALTALGIVGPFVKDFANAIEEVKPLTDVDVSNKPTLLAITSHRFRGDLEILANSGNFRVLKIPVEYQKKLISWFWRKEVSKVNIDEYFNSAKNEVYRDIQNSLRDFLRIFLPALYARLRVDCVIGAGFHYKTDFDWGTVSQEIGIPYVVLHRENLAMLPGQVALYNDVLEVRHKFRGEHIIVHNQIMKEIISQSGYTDPSKVSALGCLRMDEFVSNTKVELPRNNERKKITAFSFSRGAWIFGSVNFPKDKNAGLAKMFVNFHAAFARLAIEMPEYDFVIKPKYGGGWTEEIQDAIGKHGMNFDEIQNLSIEPDADVHKLIFASDVIWGFGSTVILEAGIARKPVIFPLFDEALKPEYADYIMFKEHPDLFDVANSPDDLKQLTLYRLDNPQIEEYSMVERNALFEKHISSLSSDALEKYISCISRIINKSKASVSDMSENRPKFEQSPYMSVS